MKKKRFVFGILLILTAFALSSCQFIGGNPPGGGGEPKEKENLIYDSDSELYFIVDASIDSSYLDELMNEISVYKTEKPMLNASVSSEPHKHEIVVGDTGREISEAAISRLGRVTKESNEEIAFLIYSDGASVAIVWEKSERDEDGVMDDVAIKYFLDNYVSEELVLKAGVVYSDAVDLVEDYYRPMDEEYRNGEWTKFENEYGKDLADAYKKLYSLYSSDCIVWLANLYDPDICVCVDLYGEDECKRTKYCGTGGFYFSNSGRDNMGYLPDAESTGQAIGLLRTLGLANKRGDDVYYGVLTEEMRKAIGDFAYALEEPNGYFYHPQWSEELIDGLSSRRSRDMSHCVGILQSLGRSPKYTTASGVKGEDAVRASAALSHRLANDTVAAVSAVMRASGDSYDSNLRDLNSFKNYLSTLDITSEYNSYPIGNELTAMCSEIKARDKQIGTAEDPTPLMDCLVEWLNSKQNSENGTWSYIEPDDPRYDPYMATNGLLKVSGVYKAHGVAMPYAKEAAVSCMVAIMADAPSDRATDIYNLWYALINIIDNLKDFGGIDGAAEADRITAELRELAAEGILLTREKIADFVRSDGSGSYYKDRSCPVSQGAPVAVSGPVEGDVNGTLIIVGQMPELISGALDIPRIRPFGEAERYIFRSTVKELGAVTKKPLETPSEFDFEPDIVGEAPEQFSVTGVGSTALVIADTTGSGKGNILNLASESGVSQSVDVPVRNHSSDGSVYVFESDMYVKSATGSYLMQISLGNCYMLTLRNVDGRLELWESSSQTNVYAVEEFLGVVIEPDEWFRLRVEYYLGDHDTVRIKVYADTDLSDGEGMKLYAVSDNYYDVGGVKISKGTGTPSSSFTKTTLLTLNSAAVDMYLDNLNTYKAKIKYEKPSKEDTPYLNIDPADSEEMIYTFDGSALDEGLNAEGNYSVLDGKLVMGGATGGSLLTPVNVRTSGAKCGRVSFALEASAVKDGGVITLTAYDGARPMFDLLLTAESDSSGRYLSLTPKGETVGAKVENLRIATDEKVNIAFEYYHDEDTVIVYLNGGFVYSGAVLYSGANKARMDGFGLTVGDNSGISIKIDDLVSEMRATRFEDAVNSGSPFKIFEFDTPADEVTLSGLGTVIANLGGDMAVKMDSERATGSINVLVNKRTPITNKAYLKFTLDYMSVSGDGITHYIEMLSADKNVILSFALKVEGNKTALYEVGKNGAVSTPLYIFASKVDVDVEIEFFPEEKTAYVIGGGKRVAKSGILCGAEYIDSPISSAVIRSGEKRSVSGIDSLRFETVYSRYENTVIDGGENSEKDLFAGLDFESSNSGNIPSFIKGGLLSEDASIGVSNLYNGVTKEYSNVLAFETVAGTNDKMSIVRPSGNSDASAVVFEADLMLDVGYDGFVYQVFFADGENGRNAYLIQLEQRNGKVKITDNSNSNNNAEGAVNHTIIDGLEHKEWFKLRVEFYKATVGDDIRIKIFVNNALVSISNNHYGYGQSAPCTEIKSVSFYSFQSNTGMLYFDNVKLFDLNATCEEDLFN